MMHILGAIIVIVSFLTSVSTMVPPCDRSCSTARKTSTWYTKSAHKISIQNDGYRIFHKIGIVLSILQNARAYYFLSTHLWKKIAYSIKYRCDVLSYCVVVISWIPHRAATSWMVVPPISGRASCHSNTARVRADWKEIHPHTKTFRSFHKKFAGLLILMRCINKLYLWIRVIHLPTSFKSFH